jgi:YVTN family beta-propeller protein
MHHRPHHCGRVGVAIVFVGLMAFVAAANVARAGSSNSLMDVSADGRLFACSNRDSGTVSVVDLRTNAKLREVKVGHKPEGVSFLGAGHTLAVAVYHDDAVVFVDADAGTTLGKADVADEPYGVVSNAAGDKVYVTLSYPGQVVEIDVATRAVSRTMAAGPFARGLAISADNAKLFVTEFYTATVLALDVASGKVVDRWPGISSDNLARQVTLHPNGRPKAYLPYIRSATEHAHGEGSIFPYVGVVDTKPVVRTPADGKSAEAVGAGAAAGAALPKRRTRIPMDSFIGTRVTANPWEIAVSPDGRRLFVVFAGTNDLFACDVVDDDYREIRHRATLTLGNNPRAVRVGPDGKTFYVYNALDFEVVAYDAATLKRTAAVTVADNPMGEEQLAGKRLFYSALQPMVGRRWISCSSCHPDGETDGRTWQQPEGLRDTPALAAMAWTHPLHWSADRDEVQDFEHTIRGQLMQGRGLIRGRVNDALGPPNKGQSPELDALAAYSNSHAAPLSPHAKGGPSASARRGKELFFSAATNCASCHSGPYYTDSTPGKPDTAAGSNLTAGKADPTPVIAGGTTSLPSPRPPLHDVGTGGDDPTEKMAPAYDTPTLLGVYKTAPYLHHGKAATLADVLTTYNRGDRHGTTSQLSRGQVDDLVEFLKALPYEDPEPRARELGMVKVER